MDTIHDSGVFGWIEQSDVSFPHMQAGEPSFFGSFSQDGAGVSIPLNSDNWLMSENEVCEHPAADSREQVASPESTLRLLCGIRLHTQ